MLSYRRETELQVRYSFGQTCKTGSIGDNILRTL